MSRTFLSAALLAAGLSSSQPALADTVLSLTFPGPTETTASRSAPITSFRMPIGPFANGSLPTELTEGGLNQTAFRVAMDQTSTLALMQPLRDQIIAAGYQLRFECETDACGGYDFRYGTDVLPEPDMHVDLGDFRYFLASKEGATAEYISLLVSRSAHDGFVQLTQVGPSGDRVRTSSPAKPTGPGPSQTAAAPLGQSFVEPGDLGKRLELGRSEVLEDLVFASGSSALSEGEYASLKALAVWLKAKPSRSVTLVGHTDASGSLAGNITLSRLRAESVRQRLLFAQGVAPGQVTAEGVGYLAPRDSNQTEAGRQKNRRVEVIATSTELLAP